MILVRGLITVKREPRYIVMAGMKFGLNKITSPQNECADILCGIEDCGVLRKCHPKAQAVIHVETFWGRRDASTAKPTSLPQTGAPKTNMWLTNQILFVCISRMCAFQLATPLFLSTQLLMTSSNNLSISALPNSNWQKTQMLQREPAWGDEYCRITLQPTFHGNTFLFLVAPD